MYVKLHLAYAVSKTKSPTVYSVPAPPACFSSQHLSLAVKTFHLLRKLSQISLLFVFRFFYKKKYTLFVSIATLLENLISVS